MATKQKAKRKILDKTSLKMDVCFQLFETPSMAARLFCTWNSRGKNAGVDSRSLLQGIFPTQESNPGLLHCRWILYHLNHQRSPFHTTVVKFISFGHDFLKGFFCILLLRQLHLYSAAWSCLTFQ